LTQNRSVNCLFRHSPSTRNRGAPPHVPGQSARSLFDRGRRCTHLPLLDGRFFCHFHGRADPIGGCDRRGQALGFRRGRMMRARAGRARQATVVRGSCNGFGSFDQARGSRRGIHGVITQLCRRPSGARAAMGRVVSIPVGCRFTCVTLPVNRDIVVRGFVPTKKNWKLQGEPVAGYMGAAGGGLDRVCLVSGRGGPIFARAPLPPASGQRGCEGHSRGLL